MLSVNLCVGRGKFEMLDDQIQGNAKEKKKQQQQQTKFCVDIDKILLQELRCRLTLQCASLNCWIAWMLHNVYIRHAPKKDN